MKTFLKYCWLLLTLAACEENDIIAVQGFQSRELFINESSGLNHVVFDLGEGLTTATTITISISGSAGMEADFIISNLLDVIDLGNGVSKVSSLESSVTTTAQVQYTVLPGQKTLTIPVKIIDDQQVEPSYETIQLAILEISETGIEIVNDYITLFISDSDAPPVSGVQVDLSWEPSSGGTINNSNFDLYLAKNVVFGNGSSAATYELVAGIASAHTTGFETMLLDDGLPDEKYYVLIKYLSGSSTNRVKLVISQNNDIQTASGLINSSQVGANLFFGPIDKSISGFSYRQQIKEPAWYGLIGE